MDFGPWLVLLILLLILCSPMFAGWPGLLVSLALLLVPVVGELVAFALYEAWAALVRALGARPSPHHLPLLVAGGVALGLLGALPFPGSLGWAAAGLVGIGLATLIGGAGGRHIPERGLVVGLFHTLAWVILVAAVDRFAPGHSLWPVAGFSSLLFLGVYILGAWARAPVVEPKA